ncbi:hypothetical protein [Leisingera daeponensis]|uniref:DUF7697 family protein n=1 Tax=Leisingera daeponensis TaxID=405746 RepID=UPI001C98CC86|nr:hypothetical protein [Leisingera daeponensis]MBY6055381.1 hypothetical protein [Leisingera daeponensis]
MRLGGQMRVASGMAARVIGWDMTAALNLGEAMGMDRLVIAEFLPDLEQVMVSEMNKRASQTDES